MAKIPCPCGASINLGGSIPNPIEWLLVPDGEISFGQMDGGLLYERMVHLFRCPTSDHLFVFWEGFDAAWTIYEPAVEVLD